MNRPPLRKIVNREIRIARGRGTYTDEQLETLLGFPLKRLLK